MKNPQSDPINPLVIALGGEPLEVTLRDGSKSTVTIALLANLEQDGPEFLRHVDDDLALAEFAAKQPAGWAATLHPASLLDVVERAMALNFPLVRRWAEHRTRKLALLEGLRGVVPGASR
jgi:hypothetical protein